MFKNKTQTYDRYTVNGSSPFNHTTPNNDPTTTTDPTTDPTIRYSLTPIPTKLTKKNTVIPTNSSPAHATNFTIDPPSIIPSVFLYTASTTFIPSLPHTTK